MPTEEKRIPHEEIARVAYLLWEEAGKPEGRAEEHWLRAEAILRRKLQKAVAAKPKRKRAAPKKKTSSPRKKLAARKSVSRKVAGGSSAPKAKRKSARGGRAKRA